MTTYLQCYRLLGPYTSAMRSCIARVLLTIQRGQPSMRAIAPLLTMVDILGCMC
jgi:hypothetical protein